MQRHSTLRFVPAVETFEDRVNLSTFPMLFQALTTNDPADNSTPKSQPFIVVSDPIDPSAVVDPTNPSLVYVGGSREATNENSRQIRHRMFSIVDRTQLRESDDSIAIEERPDTTTHQKIMTPTNFRFRMGDLPTA